MKNERGLILLVWMALLLGLVNSAIILIGGSTIIGYVQANTSAQDSRREAEVQTTQSNLKVGRDIVDALKGLKLR